MILVIKFLGNSNLENKSRKTIYEINDINDYNNNGIKIYFLEFSIFNSEFM